MLDRKVAPKSHLLKDLALTDVDLSVLGNGIKIHAFKDATNPVIKIDFVFPFGKRDEKLSGLNTVCTRLMSDATLSYSAELLQETLDQYGAHLDLSADYDDTTFSLLCLKEHFTLLLPLLKSILTEPLLDSKELEKIKLQLLQKLSVNNTKNGVIASKRLRKLLLKGSAYSSFADEKSIQSIDLDSVTKFFQRFFSYLPEVIIAGDVEAQEIDEIDKQFGYISYKNTYLCQMTTAQPEYTSERIEKEGSVQASIRLGTMSIPKQHDDYFQLSIANEILGGYFGSRLMRNLREDKGYTYGIYSSLINYEHASFQLLGADVQIDHVESAVEECFRELQLMQVEEVSAQEMETVKNYLLGKLASNLDNIFSQADNYKTNLNSRINFHQYCQDYVKAIREVSSKDILRISQKYFSQQYITVKVV